MSVVNQMLNDLQQSKQHTTVMDGFVPLPENRSKTKLYWSFILILLLIVVFVLNKSLFENTPFFTKTSDYSKKLNNNDNQPISEFEPNPKPKQEQRPEQQKTIIKTFDFKSPFEPKVIITKSSDRPIYQPSLTVNKEHINKDQINKNQIEKTKILLSNKTKPTKKLNSHIKKLSRISIAEKQFASLIKHWHLNSAQASHQKLLSLLNNYPDLPGIWLDSLAFLKNNSEKYYENLLKLSIQRFPEKISFTLLSAQYYFSSKQYTIAYQQLSSIHKTKKDQRVYQLAGLILQKLGKHQQAIGNYKKLLLIMPDRGEINMAIGISYDALQLPKRAANHFIIALKDKRLNPLQKQFVKQRLIAYQG